MFSIGVQFITGMMLGIEFPDRDDMPEDVAFSVVLDLLIVRAVLMFHKADPPIKPA